MAIATIGTALLLTSAPLSQGQAAPGAIVALATAPIAEFAQAQGTVPPVATGQSTVPPSTVPPSAEPDVIVRARQRTPGDPLQALNAKSFAVAQAVDDAVIRPASKAYQRIVPNPIRSGIRNFLINLHEPIVFLNYLLQLKPGKAMETLGRALINTTVGVAGLFDVAKDRPFKLRRRRNGLADTLGYYGVKPGAYLFLPLIGATTVRDLFGNGVDRIVIPATIGGALIPTKYAIPIGLASTLDYRAQIDEQLQVVRATSDPYSARRELYLRTRAAEIDHLHSPKYRAKHHLTDSPPLVPLSAPVPVLPLP